MNELDDIDALGAEYVLGTLSREERADVARRREAEPQLDAAISAWERRLGPLSDVVSPLTPPPHLYNKIRAQIGLSAHVVSLKAREQSLVRRGNWWRNATVVHERGCRFARRRRGLADASRGSDADTICGGASGGSTRFRLSC